MTRLEARYVVKSKLENLLKELFGTNYSVEVFKAARFVNSQPLISIRAKEM